MTPTIPLPLTPEASLNRVILHELPGVPLDDGVAGTTAYDLVGARALLQRLHQHAADLRRPAEITAPDAILRHFEGCLAGEDSHARHTARAIARTFGRGLGYVLLALCHPRARREDRPEWHALFHAHWQQLTGLRLGGGLLRGHLRTTLAEDVQSVFAEAHHPAPALHIDPHGAALPLIGAACCAPPGVHQALVLDFGGTSVKHGLARYRDGQLVRLERLPDRPTPALARHHPADLEHLLYDFIVPVVVDDWTQTIPHSTRIPISLAAYIDAHGQPCRRQGSPYAALVELTDNLQRTLSERISRATGCRLEVQLIHDGTAAASACPGTTVIVMGTALGVGYAPAVPNPLQLAPEFTLIDPLP
ncbi:MAG: hypothetical protein MUE40_20475 [Anaerolineae bacterium]|nr:hypothetical protein [Anaerolineae bacterium]